MAVRVLTYSALLYQDLLRTSTETLPAVLGALDAWLSESGNEALRLALGEWLFECASGEELLERLERAHAFLPDGQEPERQPAR